MPNWVYNTMTVTGAEETVARFIEDVAKPRPFKVKDTEDDLVIEEKSNGPLSFWSTLAPENIEGYFRGTNWYNWNIENWGTKWDAQFSEFDDYGNGQACYSFSTAWSSPDGFYKAASKKWPTLEFSVYWEEEQGFGAEFDIKDGVVSNLSEWDTPESHQDYVDLGREDSCLCAVFEDPEDWFEDCPRK